MKELLKQQIGWREDLQASGVLVGVPSFQPPRGLTVVSSGSSSSSRSCSLGTNARLMVTAAAAFEAAAGPCHATLWR